MTSTKTKKTTSTKLPPNPFIFEILEVVSKQRTKSKKVEVLKEYETEITQVTVLIWNFDETVVLWQQKVRFPSRRMMFP